MYNQPKISVIITCFNFSAYIAQAVYSVQQQDFKDTEIIVIDDASDDNSSQIIRQLAKRDSRIRIILNAENKGIAEVLKTGLEQARADLVAALDGDDYWCEPTKLSKQYHFLQTHPDYVLVGTGINLIDKNGRYLGLAPLYTSHQAVKKVMLIDNPISHSTVLFRKKMAQAAGGYGNYRINPDYCLWLALGSQGRLANLPSITASHRLTGSNASTRYATKMYIERLKLITLNRHYYPGWVKAFIKNSIEFLTSYIPQQLKTGLGKIIFYKKIKQVMFYR